MFPGQERRAVRRRMKHVSLGKDNDVWPPSTSPSPPLEYSAVDEAAITVLVVSPARLCPECKVLKTGQISELDNATARVERFLSDQDSLGALIPKGQTMPQISSPFSETIPGDKSTNVYREAVSTSSGRSVYLHPNTSIDRNLVSSARIQASPTLGCHKARAASIDIIEQFCAPAPAKPKAEPTKRVSPLKHRVAGFEEHSKRGLKRKQRPESLTNCSTACTTTKVLRPPLSPCSRNAGASIGRGLGHRNGVPTSCSPPDVSRTEVPRNSWSSLHIAPMPDSLDRENRHSETEDEAQAQFSPAYSVSSQPSLINSPTHSPGQKPWNYEFSVGSHVTVPVPTPGIPSMPRSSFTQSLQGHRGGPVVFTEEGLGKAILYSSNRDSNHEASKEKSPSSGSIDSLKAKEYLRHLNEHVENLCRERDQAVLSVETLHNEVMILKETVNVLKYDLNRWKRSKVGRR